MLIECEIALKDWSIILVDREIALKEILLTPGPEAVSILAHES